MGLTILVVAGALALLVVVYRQRAEISTLKARLTEATRTDPLTGLFNRRAFEELLNFELERSRRTGRPVAVIVGEIDGLRQLNAERGHQAGDAALQRVARDMSKWKRRIDAAGRIAGEKFGILLPETDEHGAYLVAERLRRAARRSLAVEGVPMAISFGVASYPEHGEQFGVLMGAASRAVDVARELGRDRSVVYCQDVARMLEEIPEDHVPQLSRIIALAEELDIRDAGITGHSETVGRYCEMIATELGFEANHVERIRLAGLVHDVGKTGVSDRVISKQGPLEPSEWRTVRTHPELGARILAHPDLEDLRAWVLAHHERPDGAGYPYGLVGEQIPIESRILAVADAYEAMTADRSYRSALGGDAASAELRAGAGMQFDVRVVDVFLGALARERAFRAPRPSAAAI